MDGGAWWAAVHGVAKSQTRLSDFTFTFHFSLLCIGEGNGNPLQCSCLENPRDGGAWWAAVYGVAQSQTRLKWLSSSSYSWSFKNLHCQLHIFSWNIYSYDYSHSLDLLPWPQSLPYSWNIYPREQKLIDWIQKCTYLTSNRTAVKIQIRGAEKTISFLTNNW